MRLDMLAADGVGVSFADAGADPSDSADLHGAIAADKTAVVAIAGDGIGPEIMAATRQVIDTAYPFIDWREHEAGAEVVAGGIASGVPADTIDAIAEAGVVLKAPLETPIGFGGKSANVTLRKMFELYGNIRPARTLPGVPSRFADPGIDLVIVRENVEDLYAGIEHMQTPDVAQCLKLISRKGSEKIARLAFDVARADGRRQVHCATKANILKLTEGLFKTTFEEVAQAYPDIAARHILVDHCAHQLVQAPDTLDVIVTTNMNGDILSDLAAGLVGGLGLAASANVGEHVAMFEAVHGTAPDLAGLGVANPTALILSGAMLLRHIGAGTAADAVEGALYDVLQEGRHLTADIAGRHAPVSTGDFAAAICDRLEPLPDAAWCALPARPIGAPPSASVRLDPRREFDGLDVFVEWDGPCDELASRLKSACAASRFDLVMISNRGTMVYPENRGIADTVGHWRCRFLYRGVEATDLQTAICHLLARVSRTCSWMHVERLQRFDGQPAYTLAQGQG